MRNAGNEQGKLQRMKGIERPNQKMFKILCEKAITYQIQSVLNGKIQQMVPAKKKKIEKSWSQN